MGYIISFGYSQGAIWFYNLRAPQICFRNFWDQKIDQVETQDGCDNLMKVDSQIGKHHIAVQIMGWITGWIDDLSQAEPTWAKLS